MFHFHIKFSPSFQWPLVALIHGALAIHLKIYPLIYLPSVFVHFLCSSDAKTRNSDENLSFFWRFARFIVNLLLNFIGIAYILVRLLVGKRIK